jgi:hypothetical protein
MNVLHDSVQERGNHVNEVRETVNTQLIKTLRGQHQTGYARSEDK